MRQAPFAQRPDSVRPGLLVGPFTGRVVDADTGRPLEDAIVWCSWAFQNGVGNSAPEAVRTSSTTTDPDGRYRVEALSRFPQGLSTRLATFTLLVYKRGYVAYRSDRHFGNGRRRTTFSQLGNQVELSKWSPELSHSKHLLFIGSAPTLTKASNWEVAPALAELEGARKHSVLTPVKLSPAAPVPTSEPRQRLNASQLLSSDEVRAITGYSGAFKAGRLAGPRSDTYDTFHLRAVDRPERYDLAVRIWRASDAALKTKYEEILGKLPGSKQTDEIADRSFTVQQGEILGLGLMDRASSSVVLLTCGRGQCTDPKQLKALGKKLEANLRRLPPVGQSVVPNEGDKQEDEE